MLENQEEKIEYQKYQESGGIINEKDYNSALERWLNLSQNDRKLNKQKELQAKNMANRTGLDLSENPEKIELLDKAIKLYGILRGDTKPDDVQDHHGQMNEQMLFAETLRMSGDTDSLNKFIEANHKPEAKTWCPICQKVPTPGEGCR